jgi:hypothetical protein
MAVQLSDQLPYREYQARRQREALAAVKEEQERNRDPQLEQCVIAFAAHRSEGGGMTFEVFRRQWYQERQEPTDGR